VCKRVRRHRVACIEGDTGSGKTTMIPLLLLAEDDQDVGPNRGTEAGRRLAKIVCTQPRRIAAIQVARRVAGFCNPNTLGQVTGYRVSGQSNVSEDTQIEYVTTGYLLQVLIHRPDDVHLYTHIVLDEVHERTLDSDFLSLICKRLLLRPENGDTKLVIMSATLNSDLFSQYFTDLNNGTAPKAITIQGQRFPVDDVYLNDLINDEELGKGAKKAKEEF
ncbi:ATP-dependent RNA helicase tdrd9, partial [Perkinsus olseni]